MGKGIGDHLDRRRQVDSSQQKGMHGHPNVHTEGRENRDKVEREKGERGRGGDRDDLTFGRVGGGWSPSPNNETYEF